LSENKAKKRNTDSIIELLYAASSWVIHLIQHKFKVKKTNTWSADALTTPGKMSPLIKIVQKYGSAIIPPCTEGMELFWAGIVLSRNWPQTQTNMRRWNTGVDKDCPQYKYLQILGWFKPDIVVNNDNEDEIMTDNEDEESDEEGDVKDTEDNDDSNDEE
jgi:hypothetical protein